MSKQEYTNGTFVCFLDVSDSYDIPVTVFEIVDVGSLIPICDAKGNENAKRIVDALGKAY